MRMLTATINYPAGDLMRLNFYLKKGTSRQLVMKHMIPILPLTSEKTVHCLENTMFLSKIPFKLNYLKTYINFLQKAPSYSISYKCLKKYLTFQIDLFKHYLEQI